MPTAGAVPLDPINVATLDDFKQQEPLIIARINSVSGGALLFLADPLRALQEMNVILAPVAARALAAAIGGGGMPASPVQRYYDDFKRNGPDPNVTIVFRGILSKPVGTP